MERTFVPIDLGDSGVPSIWRILRRDSLARSMAVCFVLGMMATTVFVIAHVRPRISMVGPAWLILGLASIIPLPLRLRTVRRLFRRGTEVIGRVEHVSQARRRIVVVTYRYTFEGQQYASRHNWALESPPAFNAEVKVLVDPARPSRSVLKHAFILEAVDQVPQARVVT